MGPALTRKHADARGWTITLSPNYSPEAHDYTQFPPTLDMESGAIVVLAGN